MEHKPGGSDTHNALAAYTLAFVPPIYVHLAISSSRFQSL